jgi:hypothetical protein
MPNRFDLNAPRKRRRGLAPKPRRNRARNEPKSTLLYWIVGALTVVLILAFVDIRSGGKPGSGPGFLPAQ